MDAASAEACVGAKYPAADALSETAADADEKWGTKRTLKNNKHPHIVVKIGSDNAAP